MNGKLISVFVAVMLCSIAITGCVESYTNESEPIYRTVYDIECIDTGLNDHSQIYYDVESYSKVFSGTDFWGHNEYTVTIVCYEGSQKMQRTVWEINSVRSLGNSHEIVVGYT